MKFTLNASDWRTIEQGEQDCFLLANGLGGYCSLSVIGALARGDEALLMSAKKAPNVRMHLVSNLLEKITIDGTEYTLTSQRMADGADLEGYRYLESFTYDGAPCWTYRIGDVTIAKRLLMVHGENTVALDYRIQSSRAVTFSVTPLLRFSMKNESFSPKELTLTQQKKNSYRVTDGENELYLATNAAVQSYEPTVFGEMYFSQDERDGREARGSVQHQFSLVGSSDLCVIMSTQPYEYHDGIYEEMESARQNYEKTLQERADLHSEIGQELVRSADAYVVNRESTHGKSIIAGYPFFEDWGRDTMIALAGTTMVTGRYEDCRSILRTFAQYERNGLLPNLFPEGDVEPMYNSADAPLLFINAVYEYVQYSGDKALADELGGVMEHIIACYEQGTDYHIGMDEDGLIRAGEGLEQLTWMDVRIGDELPTPRHGKPVEINAYWYNDLRIMAILTRDQTKAAHYEALAERVKTSFLTKFWNEKEDCLKDVLSDTDEENQVRCNQIWALTMPFTMLPDDLAFKVLWKVREELYTTAGLRTLSAHDAAFHDTYIGDMQTRDRAYHQGTVWAYPLGAYYRAWLRYLPACSPEMQTQYHKELADGIAALTRWLREGCLGHLAEIYDGAAPTISRGCYAQAWSVGELLRAVSEWEQSR